VGNPSSSYGDSPAIWDHTVLSATHEQVNAPAITPAMQAGTQLTYPGGMEGWVDLGGWFMPRWFTCPQTVAHPGTNHLIATRPGVEPTTSRSQVQRPNRYTTKPPRIRKLRVRLAGVNLRKTLFCFYTQALSIDDDVNFNSNNRRTNFNKVPVQ